MGAMILLILVLLLTVLLLIEALRILPYSTGWDRYPSSGLGLAVLILLALVLSGQV